MARRKQDLGNPEVDWKAEAERLRTENEQLLKEKTMAALPSGGDSTMEKYMGEIKKIQQRGRVDSNKILVKDFSDHKNISLWTKEGKRIGPLHPHNARRVFERFWNRGIQLSADQPTPDQIAAYKLTDEYKRKKKEFDRIREIKDKSRKKGTMEKYLAEIAKMTGQSVEQLNRIVGPEGIRPLREGQVAAGIEA